MTLSLPQNLALSVLLGSIFRRMASTPKKVPYSKTQVSRYPLFRGTTSMNTFTVSVYAQLVRGLASLLIL